MMTMEIGEIWGYREKPRTPGTTIVPAEILQRGPPRPPKRVRIRWVDGEYGGLDEWVNETRLICPWDAAKELLSAERQHLALAESVSDYDEVQVQASDLVLDEVLELSAGVAVMGYNRCTEGMFIVWDIEALPHITESELLAAPHAYVAAGGTYYGPWTAGVEVARRVCEHSPQATLAAIAEKEQNYRRAVATGRMRRSSTTGSSDAADLAEAERKLLELEPILALIRSWCHSSSLHEWDRVAAMRAEVDRLRSLVEEMIGWLKKAGHPVKAGEYRRQLEAGD